MDANEKAPSKFPRSSLRASNKTLIMSSMEIQEMQSGVATSQVEGAAVQRPSPEVAQELLEDSFGDSPAPLTTGASSHDALTEEPTLVSGSGVLADELKVGDGPDLLDDLFSDLTEFEATDAASAHDAKPLDAGITQSVATAGRIVQNGAAPLVATLRDEDSAEDEQAEVNQNTIPDQADDFRGEPMDTGHVQEQSARSAGQKEVVEWRRPSKLIGFLVSFDGDRFGSYVELREGRLVISSEVNSAENSLVIDDASVSPMHAIMRIAADGTVLILDQLSEHGTRIKRAGGTEECLMGDKSSLSHGDMVIFGECAYHVCILKIQVV